jgi:hypothetical protein
LHPFFNKKQEQQKIANTLSTLDNLIEAQDQKITQLKLKSPRESCFSYAVMSENHLRFFLAYS